MPEHNFRWRYPNGRASWTYPSKSEALEHRPQVKGLALEHSTDNGETWRGEYDAPEDHEIGRQER